jgi:hypothetical protein
MESAKLVKSRKAARDQPAEFDSSPLPGLFFGFLLSRAPPGVGEAAARFGESQKTIGQAGGAGLVWWTRRSAKITPGVGLPELRSGQGRTDKLPGDGGWHPPFPAWSPEAPARSLPAIIKRNSASGLVCLYRAPPSASVMLARARRLPSSFGRCHHLRQPSATHRWRSLRSARNDPLLNRSVTRVSDSFALHSSPSQLPFRFPVVSLRLTSCHRRVSNRGIHDRSALRSFVQRPKPSGPWPTLPASSRGCGGRPGRRADQARGNAQLIAAAVDLVLRLRQPSAAL